MHELSLMTGLLDIVHTYEQMHRFKRVNSLKLAFGRLSCIDSGALQFAFNLQSQGTIAEGAALLFDIRPIILFCSTCDRKMTIEQYPSSCPQCQGDNVVMQGGGEPLQLVEMEVD
jgi:hydrogenase nickel incorporation protein HypA/HybF